MNEDPDEQETIDKEFNKWWLNILQSESSHFSEYSAIKRLCRNAYIAGRSKSRSERRGEEAA